MRREELVDVVTAAVLTVVAGAVLLAVDAIALFAFASSPCGDDPCDNPSTGAALTGLVVVLTLAQLACLAWGALSGAETSAHGGRAVSRAWNSIGLAFVLAVVMVLGVLAGGS